MSRKRSASFRGVQNSPAVPTQYRRKATGLDISAIQAATQTIKETIKAQIERYKDDIEVPRRLTSDLQLQFEHRSQELLTVKKEDMANYRQSAAGMRTMLTALALYQYFEQRETSGAAYQEAEFHLKATLDDVINRLFADITAPAAPKKEDAVQGAEDPWKDF